MSEHAAVASIIFGHALSKFIHLRKLHLRKNNIALQLRAASDGASEDTSSPAEVSAVGAKDAQFADLSPPLSSNTAQDLLRTMQEMAPCEARVALLAQTLQQVSQLAHVMFCTATLTPAPTVLPGNVFRFLGY